MKPPALHVPGAEPPTREANEAPGNGPQSQAKELPVQNWEGSSSWGTGACSTQGSQKKNGGCPGGVPLNETGNKKNKKMKKKKQNKKQKRGPPIGKVSSIAAKNVAIQYLATVLGVLDCDFFFLPENMSLHRTPGTQKCRRPLVLRAAQPRHGDTGSRDHGTRSCTSTSPRKFSKRASKMSSPHRVW